MRIIEYIKDTKEFIKTYGGKKWYKNKIFISNALRMNAPGRKNKFWDWYDKAVIKIFERR